MPYSSVLANMKSGRTTNTGRNVFSDQKASSKNLTLNKDLSPVQNLNPSFATSKHTNFASFKSTEDFVEKLNSEKIRQTLFKGLKSPKSSFHKTSSKERKPV